MSMDSNSEGIIGAQNSKSRSRVHFTFQPDRELAPTPPTTHPSFTLFPKLPLEIRLAIWTLLAPPPAVIIQRLSSKKGRQFRFIREIPVVLHVCRESRIEYLETNDPTDTSLKRRQNAHPVYKLYFGNSTKTGCKVFMSNFDSVWTTWPSLKAKWMKPQPSLKHLFIDLPSNPPTSAYYIELNERFPKLEVITFIISLKLLGGRSIIGQWSSYGPEMDGEMDEANLRCPLTSYFLNFKYACKSSYAIAEKLGIARGVRQDGNFAVLKFRIEEQFMENENIRFPMNAYLVESCKQSELALGPLPQTRLFRP